MELTVREIRERLELAMGVANDPNWLAEAEAKLEAHRLARQFRRAYDISTVGRRIKTAREVLGLSQAQFGRRLGMSRVRVQQIENGVADLPGNLLLRFSTALSVHPGWLLMERDDGGPDIPDGVVRRQHRPGWQKASHKEKLRAQAKAELERLRGLRGPKRDTKVVPTPTSP